MKREFPVIYLTGAPATGKSTLCNRLKLSYPRLSILSYSEILAARLSKKSASISQCKLRAKSAVLITPKLIQNIDQWLIQEVKIKRFKCPVIIDSHAVTIESFGYRVIPFSMKMIHALNPTHIVCLFAPSGVIINRITKHSKGRPIPSPFQADFHTYLQAQVAIDYGIALGRSIYFLESKSSNNTTVQTMRDILKAS